MDLSNRCRAADVAAGCRRRRLGRQPADDRPPLVGRLRHRRRRAAEQAGPDQRGGREDGAHAEEEEEEAPAPASIVRSVAVVRPYESVRPSVVRFFGHHRRRFTPSIAPPLLRCLPLSHRVGAELQSARYFNIRPSDGHVIFMALIRYLTLYVVREGESAVTANHR